MTDTSYFFYYRPILSKMDCLQGYVLVSNVPDNSFDELSGKLCRSDLPCGFKRLIYLKGAREAVLVCNTSEGNTHEEYILLHCFLYFYFWIRNLVNK